MKGLDLILDCFKQPRVSLATAHRDAYSPAHIYTHKRFRSLPSPLRSPIQSMKDHCLAVVTPRCSRNPIVVVVTAQNDAEWSPYSQDWTCKIDVFLLHKINSPPQEATHWPTATFAVKFVSNRRSTRSHPSSRVEPDIVREIHMPPRDGDRFS